jgi:hypothetical protein
MARSKFLIAVLLALNSAYAQVAVTPVPTDIPWAAQTTSVVFTDDKGMSWSADGGVYLNDPAREQEKSAIQELRDQNSALASQLKDSQAETEAYKITPEQWVAIATSIVGSVGAAVAACLAATQKH